MARRKKAQPARPVEGSTKTDSLRKKYFPGADFLKADDIEDETFVRVLQFEEIKTRIGDRPVLRLKGLEKPLGLNATNWDKMTEKFGPDPSDWEGKKVELIIIRAHNPQTKKEQDAIRIR